jgi:phospho-N-acetylmuramoyl-pentapeptide-transferase
VISILVAAAVGLAFTLLGTPVAIRAFRVWGWGQRIREDGPHTHFEKVGTPTMGGIVMVGALVVAYLVTRFTLEARLTFSPAGLALLLAVIGFGVVGFLRPTALTLGVLFFLWVFVMLTASSHAVNLTDGLDGLAAGSTILVFAAYVFIAFWQFRHTCEQLAEIGAVQSACYRVDLNAMQDTAIIAAAMMGAAAGFLWWNAAPARIFMGDTGSLALGGLLGALAITTNTQLLLIILGGLYVIETMSVIVQVISFRGFGRRVFRMSPIHHHFELAGWPEFTVIVRFWIIAGLCVAVGLGVFYADFIARGGLD